MRAAVDMRLTLPLLAAGVIVAAFVARILLDRYVLAPWIMVDELQYAQTSRSFISTGHYLFRDQPEAIKSIYPALISPAWLAGSVQTSYTLIKVINSALMVAGAIPLYLWARRLVAPAWATLAIAFYLAMPGFAYTAEILTENAYVPATVLALFAISVALERPTIGRQLLALLAIALAIAIRLQGLIFLAILPTAIALVTLFDVVAAPPEERRATAARRLRRYVPVLGGLAFAVLLYVVYQAARGASVASGLGIYRNILEAHYAVRPAVTWIVYHAAELAFSVALIPVSALIVLAGLACRRTTAPTPAERAFLAVTLAGVFWLVVQIGTFASHYSVRIEERYMFNVAPALFLALVVWLARGLPRPPGLTAAAAVAPIAVLLALPYETLFTGALFNDTFGLIPLWRLTTRLTGGGGEVRVLVGAGALIAAIIFASVPRTAARLAVPAVVAGFLVLSSGSVFAQVVFHSEATRRAGGLSGDPSWIDHAIGSDNRVEFLYTTDIDRDQHILWQSEFWNKSVRRVFGVTSQDPSIPDVTAPLSPATGRIEPGLSRGSPDLHPRYVVAASNVAVAGTRIAQAGLLALYRVRPPLGLASTTSGLEPDSWTDSSATYTVYRAPAVRSVRVLVWRPELSGPPPAHVQIGVGPVRVVNGVATLAKAWETKRWTVRNGTRHLFTLPVRKAPFQVQLTVSPTFSPAQYGSPDARQLGVLASFSGG